MPLYEYQCDACGHRFEVIQKSSDSPIPTCPTCGGVVHKLQSAPAIQFKGTGFYITDYAKKDQKESGKPGSGSKDGKDGPKDSGKDGGKDSGKDGGKDSGDRGHTSDKPSDSGKAASSDSGSSSSSSSSSSSTEKSTPVKPSSS